MKFNDASAQNLKLASTTWLADALADLLCSSNPLASAGPTCGPHAGRPKASCTIVYLYASLLVRAGFAHEAPCKCNLPESKAYCASSFRDSQQRWCDIMLCCIFGFCNNGLGHFTAGLEKCVLIFFLRKSRDVSVIWQSQKLIVSFLSGIHSNAGVTSCCVASLAFATMVWVISQQA